MLLDIPILLIIPLTLWRLPFLIIRLRKENSAMQRRFMVLKELYSVIKGKKKYI